MVRSLYLSIKTCSELFHRTRHFAGFHFHNISKAECIGALIAKSTQFPVKLLLSQFIYNLLTTFTAKIHPSMFVYLPKSRLIRLQMSAEPVLTFVAILTQIVKNNQWVCSFETKATTPF